MSNAKYTNDLFYERNEPAFVSWNNNTANTPCKAGLTDCQEGFAFCYGKWSDYQTTVAFAKNSNKMWIYSKFTQEWTEYATKDDLWPQNSGTKITANTDMHTITTSGHYYCQGNNTAATLKNCPCTVAFTLTVYRGAGGSTDGMYIIQEYTTYLGDARVIQVYNEDSKNWTVHRISFSS